MSAILIDTVVKSFANAGKVYGKTSTILSDAFKLALENGVDENGIADYQHAFYLNGVKSALKLSHERAFRVVIGSKVDKSGLSPFDKKNPEKNGASNRTFDEQSVVDNLKSAFSNGRKLAGFPMKAVTPRAPRAVTAPVVAPGAVEPDMRIIGCTADAINLASEIAAELNALNKKSAKKIVGDGGQTLRDAIVAFIAAVAKAKKQEAEKDAPKVLAAA